MRSPRSTRWMLAALLGAAVVLAANGCASIQAARAEQAKWQAMADQVTAHYGAASVRVELTGDGLGSSKYYGAPDRRIEFAAYRTYYARASLAHELSHHLLGHWSASPTEEMAANARAVQVMQLWGVSEHEAVLMFAWWFRGIRYVSRGHLSACDELVALHVAYPGHVEPDKWVAHGCPAVGADGTRRGDTATGR